MIKPKQAVVTVAALAAAGLGGSALADAATQSATPTPTPSAQGQRPAHGAGEQELTGTTAEKVKAAALAKVPGTVMRVETDNGGVYEAHIRKSDGTEVEVKVDKDFNVTATQEHGPGGHGQGGPGRGGAGAGEQELTGTTAEKVKAAALAKVPGTVLRVETDNGGVYEAHIRKSDGTEVEVKVDKDFNVTATEEHDRP